MLIIFYYCSIVIFGNYIFEYDMLQDSSVDFSFFRMTVKSNRIEKVYENE